MKRGLSFDNNQIQEVFSLWNKGDLNSYLVEITSHIFTKQDETTGNRIIDEISDEAKQKGTGGWTSQSAMELQVPIPTIDAAITMRNLSAFTKERNQIHLIYPRSPKSFMGHHEEFLDQLGSALSMALIITYAQGLSLLAKASLEYKYDLHLEEVAKLWRGGCIIRATLLNDIASAFKVNPDLSNLLLDANLSRKVLEQHTELRNVLCQATDWEVPTPALMCSLSYFDSYRSNWLPSNLIQAQRDYFGAHGYERVDAKGTFHTEWEKK
jgi:6-phosphogluconate dehydrogenase